MQAAAAGIGVSRQQLHRVISGVSGVTPEMAVRLEKAIGSSASAWLAMQAAHDLSRAREVIGEIPRLAAKVTDVPRP
ncbi:MAG: HigA family addiction module antitoxin [Bauldia sp.]